MCEMDRSASVPSSITLCDPTDRILSRASIRLQAWRSIRP